LSQDSKLPECRHRRTVSDDRHFCNSNRLVKLNVFVTDEVCRQCAVAGGCDLPNLTDGRGASNMAHGMLYELSKDAEHLGLGDMIEKLAKFTGLSKLAEVYERLTGKPCGCSERREKLNRWKIRGLFRGLFGRKLPE